jgi:hypothetical protein
MELWIADFKNCDIYKIHGDRPLFRIVNKLDSNILHAISLPEACRIASLMHLESNVIRALRTDN